MKKSVLILGAGSGRRMKSELPKQYILIKNKPIIFHTIEKFSHFKEIVVVINKDQDIIKCMARIARFYKHESCGQCTPCREGSGWMWRMLERMSRGEASKDEIEMLADVTKQIEGHTICAFGEGSSWPVQGLLRHFKDEIKKRNKFDPVVKESKNIPYLVDQHLLDKNA